MAEYIPITDQEIEPEAPITSILQHKIRDNPIAIAEQQIGAPTIEVWANNIQYDTTVITFSTTIENGIYILGGGLYSFNAQTSTSSNTNGGFSAMSDFADAPNQNFSIARRKTVSFLLAGVSPRIGYLHSNYFDSRTLQSSTFIYLVKEKITGKIFNMAFFPIHPSYGNIDFIEHPFDSYSTNDFDIFMGILSFEDWFNLKLKTIPLVGGGYLDQNLYNSGTFEIDYFSNKKEVDTVFNENFAFDLSSSPEWLPEKFNIFVPILGNRMPEMVLPEPNQILFKTINPL